MPGDLTTGSGADFQQQGSVDWVSLSKSSYTFALDVLVRLSRAELNPATLAVASITCGQFIVKPDAQKRIHEALSRLRSFSAYGKIAWFGFGVKSIIKDLADTEHGMACVALCACMSVSYDSFFAATVLRELCRIRATPLDIIPSLHQWKTLLHICSGSLSYSKFPTLLEGLKRLVQPQPDLAFHRPTSEQSLAKAIGGLADVSNKKLSHITIVGGLDCVWLAAVAEWLLSLDVEIRLNSGRTVYKSNRDRHGHHPGVIIIFVSENEENEKRIQLIQCFNVPQGYKFWHSLEQNQLFLRGGRCDWTEILANTFGSQLHALLEGKLQRNFTLFLWHASRWAETYYRYGPIPNRLEKDLPELSTPFQRFNFAHPSSRGRGFLEFAARNLPEIAGVVTSLDYLDIDSSKGATSDYLESFAPECECQSCGIGETVNGSPQFCLKLIAETIVLFIWLLSATEADESLKPSPQGLRLLYMKHQGRHHNDHDKWKTGKRWKYSSAPYFPSGSMDILTAVLIIFAGPMDTRRPDDEFSSAISRNGICVFFRGLEDLDQCPERVGVVRVVPGQIDFEGRKYERICDLGDSSTAAYEFGPTSSYKLVVEDTPQPECVAAAYKLTCDIHSYQQMLGISALATKIARSLRGPIECGDLCGQKCSQSWGTVLFAAESTPTTQKSLGELASLTSSWSLVSAPEARLNNGIQLRLIQPTIRTLYTKFMQENEAYHLAYVQICDGCLQLLKHTTHEETAFSSSQSSEGTIIANLAVQNRYLVERSFDIVVAAASDLLSPPDQNVDGTIPALALHTAAAVVREGMLQLLLQGGANVNSSGAGGDTALHFAAKEGHSPVVKILLAWGAQVDMKDKNGQSPLSAAVCNGHESITCLIIERGALIDSRDARGKTPLSLAAGMGYRAIVERLLQEKADVNFAPAYNGRSALQAAAEGGHLAVVERLLQEQADVNVIARGRGRTSLQAAAGGGHLAVVERLLQEKADVNAGPAEEQGRTALQAAAGGGYLAVVERLLQEKADVNAVPSRESGRTALQAAAECGHLAVVERLLQENAAVNAAPSEYFGRTALQAAAECGHLEIIERLLQEHADVNAAPGEYSGRTALQAAAGGGHLAVVERLLQEKAGVNAAPSREVGSTALQAAAGGGHLAVVERLLQEKADVNAILTRRGRTALQAAAEGGHLAVVERLLQEKADVNAAPTYDGPTALQAAAKGGHLTVVERLLQENADVNAGPAGLPKRTALQAAAEYGHLEIIERLLQEHADVNAAPSEYSGRTALQAAAECGHLEIIERLLQEHADVNAAPSEYSGRTALQAAAGGGHLAVIERLLQEKADVNASPSREFGSTALQAAAEGGHLVVVGRLRQAGAIRR